MKRHAKRTSKKQNRGIRKHYHPEMEQFERRWLPGDAFLGPVWLSALASIYGNDRLGSVLEGGRGRDARQNLSPGAADPHIIAPWHLSILAHNSGQGPAAWPILTGLAGEQDFTSPTDTPRMPDADSSTAGVSAAQGTLTWDWISDPFADPVAGVWGGGAKAGSRMPVLESQDRGSVGGGDGVLPGAVGSSGAEGSGPVSLAREAEGHTGFSGGRAVAPASGPDLVTAAQALGGRGSGSIPSGERSPLTDGPPSGDSGAGAGTPPSPPATSPRPLEVQRNYARTPLAFEPNRGQTDSRAHFLSRGRGYNLFFSPTEAVVLLQKQLTEPQTRAVVRLQLAGANPAATATGVEQLPGVTNYLLGNDSRRWRTNIPNYGKVMFTGVYPGVDLVYYGTGQRQLEFDFIVAPGANPSAIQLAYQGVSTIRLNRRGNLVLSTVGGDLEQKAPVIYQLQGGRRQIIAGAYVLQGPNRVGFRVGPYDTSRPLYIDPVLSYSTYLGGSGNDAGLGIAVDSRGSAYVTGYTFSSDFPGGGLQPGGRDAFVTKLDATGTRLLYSTYLGGSGEDQANGIALDTDGNAYVTGFTRSTNFPTVGAYQSTLRGVQDAFVAKLNATGDSLLYSTYLGGVDELFDHGHAIAVDTAGRAYVTGRTDAENFPTTPGVFQSTYQGRRDAFVAKFDPTETGNASLLYSTFLGGSSEREYGFAIAVDATGNAYVAGHTHSTNFPTLNALQTTLGDNGDYGDAFLAKLNTGATALLYSTYLGGGLDDDSLGLAVDGSGHAYLTGVTNSTNFWTTPSAYQSSRSGNSRDAFVTKIDPTQSGGNSLLYSTYLGGSADENETCDAECYIGAIAVDAQDKVYVTGSTLSTNFPVLNPFQPTNGGARDAFVAKLDLTLSGAASLLFSTYLGGTDTDYGNGIAIGNFNSPHVTGLTTSADFPVATSLQDYNAGGEDAFIVKFGPPLFHRRSSGGSENPGGSGGGWGNGSYWLCGCVTHAVSPSTGAVRVVNPLDFRRSLGSFADLGQAAGLVYNSDTVNVRPIVELAVGFDPALGLPTSPIQLDLTWDGVLQNSSLFDGATNHSAGDVYLLASQVATPVTSTGAYTFEVRVQTSFSGGKTVDWSFADIALVVANDSSPFGRGWSLAGLDRLVGDGDRGLIMVYGSGDGSHYFTWNLDGSLSSPSDDFGTMGVELPNTYLYVSKDQTIRRFDGDTGLLQSITDWNNLRVTYLYDASDRLTMVRMPDGGDATFEYTGGLLARILEPGNRTVTITRAGVDVTGITNPDGNLRSFTYGTLSYDLNRLRTQQWGPTFTTYSYDQNNTGVVRTVNRGSGTLDDINPTSIQGLAIPPGPPYPRAKLDTDAVAVYTDALSRRTTYTLDAQGRLTQMERQGIPTQTWPRDHAGQTKVFTDARGLPTYYTYWYGGGGLGDLARIDYADGTNEEFKYDPVYHYLSERKDQRGNLTTMLYDAQGNLTRTTDALGRNWDQTWGTGAEAGLLKETISPRQVDGQNLRTTYLYEPGTRRLQVVRDALNQRVTYTYDPAGNVETVEDQLGRITSRAYDGMRRLTTQVDANNGSMFLEYDALGRVTLREDEEGRQTTYLYDARGWQTEMTEAANDVAVRRTTTTLYDAVGNATVVVGPRRINDQPVRTTFLYDALNRQTGTLDALGQLSQSYYDAAGNVTAVEDNLGRQTTYAYDSLNRRTAMTEAANHPSVKRTTQYVYDQAGNLTVVISPRQMGEPLANLRTTFLYDALNRSTVTVDALGFRATVLYDEVGNVTMVRDQLDRWTTHVYDKLDRRTFTTEAAQPGATERRTTETVYDAVGNVSAVVDGLQNRTSFLYDALNRRTVTIDALDRRTTLTLDKVGNVLSVEDALNRKVTYAYDALNRRTEMTEAAHLADPNPLRRRTQYVYDEADNLTVTVGARQVSGVNLRTTFLFDALNRQTAVWDMLDRRATTLYDAVGNVTTVLSPRVVDSQPLKTEFQYDALNRRTVTIDALGQQTTSTYDVVDNLVEVEDALNRKTTYAYDALNRRTFMTESAHPAGAALRRETEYVYDKVGNLTVVVSPRQMGDPATNLRTTFVYDALNRSTVTIDALGFRATTLYDAADNVTMVRDQLDRWTTFTYDELNRHTETTEGAHRPAGSADRRSSGVVYDVVGNVTVAIDAQDRRTTFLFDALNRRTVTVDPLGQRVTATLDLADNVTEVRDQLNRGTSYSYDAVNRREETTEASHVNPGNPPRRVSTVLYDAADNVTGVYLPAVGSNPNPRLTSYVYDKLNRRTEMTEGAHLPTGNKDRRTTATGYDAVSNVTVVVDPINNRTTFLFDALNRVSVTITTADTLTLRATVLYDKADNVTSITDRNDRERRFTYDALNRRTDETWVGSAQNFIYLYDMAGQLTLASDNFSGYTFSPDALGRATIIGSNIGIAGRPQVTFTQDFSKTDRRTTLTATLNGGTKDFANSYAYDTLDRMTSVVQAQQSGGTINPMATKRVTMAYNALNQFASITRKYTPVGGGSETVVATTTYDNYDDLNRLGRIQHSSSPLVTYTYLYDAGDRITRMTVTDNGVTNTNTYTHDAVDQLVTALHGNATVGTETYVYDKNGNREQGGTYTYETFPNSNRLKNDGLYTYAYDNEGNRTKRWKIQTGEYTEYTWDYRNRLARVVTKPSEGSATISRDVTYTYDVFDRRIAKQVDIDGPGGPDPVTTTHFVYDGAHIALVFENSAFTAPKTRYLHGPMVDQIFAQETASTSTVLWPLTDHLGTVRDLADSTGVISPANHILYDSFGKLKSIAPTDLYFAYTGREHDAESGMYYYRARYYDAGVGRFLNEDPLGVLQGDKNPYRYVSNDPLTAKDSTGLDKEVVTTDFQRIPAARVKALIKDKLAQEHEGYAYIADTTMDGKISVRILEPYEEYTRRVSGYRRDFGPCEIPDKRSLRTSRNWQPNSSTFYRMVRYWEYPGIEYTHLNPAPLEIQIANFRKPDSVRLHTELLLGREAAASQELIAGVLTFALHVVPGGAAIDHVLQGQTEDAVISLAGDLALGFGTFAKAVKGAKLARNLHLGAATVEGGVASYRVGQSIFAFREGNNVQALGYLGEATLRLLGMSADAIGALKAARSAAKTPVTTPVNSPLLQRYLSESGGRWGGTTTRQLNHQLATDLERQGFRITGGAGRAAEEWIPGPGGGTKGGTWVDITATNGTRTTRIQTVTTLADGVTPTAAEAAAAARIRAAFPNDVLRLVPKPR